MTAQVLIKASWRDHWLPICVLIAAGTTSTAASARGSAAVAYGAAPGPLNEVIRASTDTQAKGTGFAVPRHVIAGGGGTSTGGVFAIQGTIGQADADPLQPSTGGVFAITGGFWPGITPAAPLGDPLFANGFEPSVP